MKFIASLAESRLFSSNTAYRKFSAQTLSELAILHICALRILASDIRSHSFATGYAVKSARMLKFARFYTNTTDLSLLIYPLLNPQDVDFMMPEVSEVHLDHMDINEREITAWLKEIARGHINEGRTRHLFTYLDRQFNIKSTTIRSIRRLVQDWPRLDHEGRELAMRRMIQIIKTKAPRSDILHELLELSRHLGIRHTDDHDGHDHVEPEKKKGLGFLGSVAAAVLGYHAGKKIAEDETVTEDASAGATCAAGIAPTVVPLGKVQRRPSPVKPTK